MTKELKDLYETFQRKPSYKEWLSFSDSELAYYSMCQTTVLNEADELIIKIYNKDNLDIPIIQAIIETNDGQMKVTSPEETQENKLRTKPFQAAILLSFILCHTRAIRFTNTNYDPQKDFMKMRNSYIESISNSN